MTQVNTAPADASPVTKPAECIEVMKIREMWPDAVLDVNTFRGDTRILVPREHIVDICRLMRDDPDLQYNFFAECLGVDYLDTKPGYRFEVVYNLYSMPYTHNGMNYGTNRRIFLKIGVPEQDSSAPSV